MLLTDFMLIEVPLYPTVSNHYSFTSHIVAYDELDLDRINFQKNFQQKIPS